MVEARMLSDAGVSPREAEVLQALGEHLTNAEIAARLYISVRTVESHVSSLLRKLGLHDRRELARLAAARLASEGRTAGADAEVVAATGGPVPAPGDRAPGDGAGAAPLASRHPGAQLPVPLTPFVGRAVERRELAAAVGQNRLVTAVGPGGVGKTRLALAVASDLAGDFPDVWWVDLVPVTDPAMIAAAVASAVGLTVPSARSTEDTVIESLTHCRALLVLDNCEHLVAGVAVFVERLLTHCPQVVVLATSRARLLVPFERVFPVPGLSYDGAEGDEPADAVALFLARAEAVGAPVTKATARRRVAAICRALDGVALAIELAAARLPALGLDGLEAGLTDRLRLLAGGSRAEDRHSSLRGALDWSFDLLDPVDQAVLRRVSVFASAFTVDDAAAVAGFPPITEGKETETILDAIGGLVEQSLVVAVPGPDGTRYRVLETIRQYGADRLAAAGEADDVRERHLDWCTAVVGDLDSDETSPTTGGEDWRRAFDAVAADVRAALGWIADRPERRSAAHDLALRLAVLAYRRGLTAESQQRYEQAAELTEGTARAEALRQAAYAAAARHAGDDALHLAKAAARTARAAGDGPRAARDLAWAAMLAKRASGIVAEQPPPLDVDAALAEAHDLAGDDPAARAAVLVGVTSECDEADPSMLGRALEAVTAAQQVGDVLLESAALDELTVLHAAAGDHAAAVESTRRRMDLLADVRLDADSGFELHDGYQMAAEAHVGMGDLRGARHYSDRLLHLPAYREGHLGASRLLLADALAGQWDAVLAAAARFRLNWERAGRPLLPYLSLGTGAVAMVHGLRGDDDARTEWLDLTATLWAAHGRSKSDNVSSWRRMFEAIVLLHRGRLDEALVTLRPDPADITRWQSGMWRQWYAALWAEAAVLAGHLEAEDRLGRAGDMVAGNPIASAIVARADAWHRGDRNALLAAADALAAADCPYQQARTLVLAGPPDSDRGQALLAALGATPTPVAAHP